MVLCQVVLLDQERFMTEVSKGALGQELFDNVKQKLTLEEADYFGLSFRDSKNVRNWLNLDKRIDKQVESKSNEPPVLYWEVKFYPPAPEIVNEDLTRYLVVLQVRHDLFSGRLPASFQTLAILGSYTIQAEIGDYEKGQMYGIEYLRNYNFAPKQSEELLARIADLHKTRKGLTPAEADLCFLDNAKKMALYGMDKYPVKDSTNHDMLVGVSASGLYLYDDKLRMDSFKWPSIIKISYKRNIFFIKVRPGEFEKHEKTHGFKLPNPKLAKRLWRIAVEHHQFFRLNQPELTDTGTLGFGPRRWRMSGRTQAQLKSVGTPKRSFSRSNSIMSSDTYTGTHGGYGTSTLPLHGNARDMDGLGQGYNTYGGRRNEKMVTGYDENGQAPIDYMNDSSMSRDQDSTLNRGPNAYHSEDDLLNGRAYNPATGTMDSAGTLGRLNGGHDYEQYEDLSQQNSAPLAPVTDPYGVGELPMPRFMAESAGTLADGSLDPTARLDTSERGEKYTTDREGYSDKRSKNKLVVSGDVDLDDKLLLDAIQAVTGLDPSLGVDKIEIKTEEEST